MRLGEKQRSVLHHYILYIIYYYILYLYIIYNIIYNVQIYNNLYIIYTYIYVYTQIYICVYIQIFTNYYVNNFTHYSTVMIHQFTFADSLLLHSSVLDSSTIKVIRILFHLDCPLLLQAIPCSYLLLTQLLTAKKEELF